MSDASSKPKPHTPQDRRSAGAVERALNAVKSPARSSGTIPAGLYLVATPIGNLRDITLRALDVLHGADLIACEDTRVTARLKREFGIITPLQTYHDHNAAQKRPALLQKIANGAAVALVSDAGTPLISDPGFKLVREAADLGLQVIPVPGASSVLAALTVSGLPTDQFTFAGFVPSKAAARERFFTGLKDHPATLILFETGPRLAKSLAAMIQVLGDREVAVTRELTKRFEEVRRDDLQSLAAHYADPANPTPKGEIVIVVGPPDAMANKALSDEDIDRLLEAALDTMTVKDAVASVTAQTDLPRKKIYTHALALNRKS